MATAYEVLGIKPNATRQELDAAYATQRAAYDPTQAAELGDEFVEVAVRRRAELAAAYRLVQPALRMPPQLAPEAERRRDRETLIALLALVLLALAVPLLRNVAVPERTVMATAADSIPAFDAAPGFSLETLDGKRVSLEQYKGKVVLINFWATWCPPCVREIPRLVRVSEQYRSEGLVVLGINTTYQDDRAKVERFVREQSISYPVLLDTEGKAGQVYPARLMPTSYLINRDGKIASVKVGEVDEATLQEQVAALLKEP